MIDKLLDILDKAKSKNLIIQLSLILFLIPTLIIIAPYYLMFAAVNKLTNNILTHIELKKVFENTSIDQIIPFEQTNEEHEELYFSKELKEEDISLLTDIYNTLKTNCIFFNLNYFKKNVKTLKIEKTKFEKVINKRRKFFLKGRYDVNENCIYIEDRIYLSHEVYHVANASKKKDGTIINGFLHIKNNNFIGSGINEGYTNVFDERYFAHRLNISVFPFETVFSILIEKLITENKMGEYYSNQDLMSLVLGLSEFDSIENIIRLIKDIDYINYYFPRNKKNLPKKLMIKIEKVFFNLIKYNLLKQDADFKNGLISRTVQIQNIIYIINLTGLKIRNVYRNFFYYIVSLEELSEMFVLNSNEEEAIRSFTKF